MLTYKAVCTYRNISQIQNVAENYFAVDVEGMMFGFAKCAAPSLLEKELEDEAIVHLSMIWEEKQPL